MQSISGGNATLHLENPGFHAEIHAEPAENIPLNWLHWLRTAQVGGVQ